MKLKLYQKIIPFTTIVVCILVSLSWVMTNVTSNTNAIITKYPPLERNYTSPSQSSISSLSIENQKKLSSASSQSSTVSSHSNSQIQSTH